MTKRTTKSKSVDKHENYVKGNRRLEHQPEQCGRRSMSVIHKSEHRYLKNSSPWWAHRRDSSDRVCIQRRKDRYNATEDLR